MKRFMLFSLALVLTLTLSACGLFRDNPSRSADRVIDEWDGSLQFLSNAMDEMKLDEQFEMRHTLSVDLEENGVRDQLYVEALMRGVKQNGLYTTEYLFEITLPEAADVDLDTVSLNFIVQEQGDAFDFYLNIDTIREIATIEEVDDFFDILDMFAINESWVRFTFADNMQNIVELEMLETLLELMNMEFVLDYIFDQFGLDFEYELGEIFDEAQTHFDDAQEILFRYFNLDYIGTHEYRDIELIKTEDNHIRALVTMDHVMLASLFEAFIYDAYDFLVDIGEAPEGIDPLEGADLEEILSEMPAPIIVGIEYDPHNLDFMKVSVDLIDLIEGANPNLTVFEFKFETEVKNTTSITIPTTFGDLNRVAEEAAKTILMIDIMDMMFGSDLYNEEGVHTLTDYYPNHNALFHPTLSTITITSQNIVVDLYYIDDAVVFTSPLNVTQLEDTAPEMMTRAFIEHVIEPFSQATFSMTRFFAWTAGSIGEDLMRSAFQDRAYDVRWAAGDFCWYENDDNYCSWSGDNQILTSSQLDLYIWNTSRLDGYEYATRYIDGVHVVLIANNTHYFVGNPYDWPFVIRPRAGQSFNDLVDEYLND